MNRQQFYATYILDTQIAHPGSQRVQTADDAHHRSGEHVHTVSNMTGKHVSTSFFAVSRQRGKRQELLTYSYRNDSLTHQPDPNAMQTTHQDIVRLGLHMNSPEAPNAATTAPCYSPVCTAQRVPDRAQMVCRAIHYTACKNNLELLHK